LKQNILIITPKINYITLIINFSMRNQNYKKIFMIIKNIQDKYYIIIRNLIFKIKYTSKLGILMIKT
jgi:hypothetical protein